MRMTGYMPTDEDIAKTVRELEKADPANANPLICTSNAHQNEVNVPRTRPHRRRTPPQRNGNVQDRVDG